MKKAHILLALLIFLLIGGGIFATVEGVRQRPTQKRVSSQFNPIPPENQLTGTVDWRPHNPAPYSTTTFRSSAIEGYAWTTSATTGEIISFSVSTTTPTFAVDIYRLGWYGGQGARRLQTLSHLPGIFHPMPAMDPQTGLIEAHWPITFTIRVEPSWVSGIYIAKLIAATGEESYIPFVIRSNRSSDFVFIHAASTDQAYNNWGGKSLYSYNSTGGQRAYKISFDRPFIYNGGLGNLLYWEYPMLRWLEKQRYDVSYLSTTDIEEHPSLLLHHHGILLVGHNEYWSKGMRDALEAAVNNGVNLAAFAADTMQWQIRYEASSSEGKSVPDRIIVCYKDAALDPLTENDHSRVTVEWRSPLINRPEQLLLGGMLAGSFNFGTAGYDWVVADASHWIFEGTGLQNGDRLSGLVGYEYDKVFTAYPIPAGLRLLSNSSVHSPEGSTTNTSNATIYTARSGARVFNVATIQWSWGLDDYGRHKVVNSKVQKITENILANFLTAPGGP